MSRPCVALPLILLFGISVARAQSPQVPADSTHLSQIAGLIEENYWRPVSRDSALSALRRNGLAAFDPYSMYLSPTDLAFFDANIHAAFGGIGARISQDSTTTRFHFLGTFFGSPARQAGIRPGDVLIAVDGNPVTGRTMDDVLLSLRGEPRSTVKLDLEHEKVLRSVAIQRAVIHVSSVRGARRAAEKPWDYEVGNPPDVAYARITSFTASTAEELDAALRKIQRTDAKALVLDLRGDPGGMVASAVAAADLFLDSTLVVTLRGRTGPEEARRASPGVSTSLPLALLIDAETMSAAEIFAAALQDNHRAVVVGARSYGKGAVQQILHLPDSTEAVKLTTSNYVRPSGRPIERHLAGVDSALGGVWPDSGMAVVLSTEEAARVNGRLAQGDQFGGVVEVAVEAPNVAEDPALARACAALAGRTTPVTPSPSPGR